MPVWRGRSSLTYSKFFGKKSKLPLTLSTFFGVSIALSSSWSSLLLSLPSMLKGSRRGEEVETRGKVRL